MKRLLNTPEIRSKKWDEVGELVVWEELGVMNDEMREACAELIKTIRERGVARYKKFEVKRKPGRKAGG